MSINTDFEIQLDKDIRYIGAAHGAAGSAYYTVIELHRWLQDLADDASASGDDFMDITELTPSDRSTDNIITLLNGYNIDTTASEHLYGGSIIQNGGATIYDGILVYANQGMDLQIQQNGAIIANDFWNIDTVLSGVVIADTAGGFTCSASPTPLAVGQFVTISGTFGGTGSITDYVNPTTYRISATNGSTSFTLVTFTGAALVTTAGTPTGLTYTGRLGVSPDSANGISHRFCIKVRDNGYDIDGRILTTQTRVWGFSYSEFKINGTSRGNNVSALTFASDLNNSTLASAIAALTNITNTEGYRSIDVNNDTVVERYYSEWNTDGETINDFYQRIKWLQRQGSASTMYGINGELFRGITHEIVVDTPSGTFSATEPISWGLDLSTVVIAGTAGEFTCAASTIVVGQTLRISGTYGGTGSIAGYVNPTSYLVSATNGTTSFTLVTTAGAAIVTTAGTPTGLRYDLRSGTGISVAINSPTAATKMWIQLLSGVAPVNNQLITGNTSSANCLMNVTITERTLSFPAAGVSTGTSLIGGYGFGIEALDLSASDKVFDLDNVQWQAPNNVTFTVSNLVAGDRVLVTNDESTGIDLNQFTTTATLDQATETTVDVSPAIPLDTPATGFLRVLLDSGFYRRVEYTSWSGSSFTLAVGPDDDWTGANVATIGNNVFIGYIDGVSAGATMSFTSVFNSNRTMFVRVRNGSGTPKIKTYETTADLTSAGGSASTSRISDE